MSAAEQQQPQRDQPCECEHARHFDEGGANAGHRYGAKQAAVSTYSTVWGRFNLCHWCWEVCHDGILDLAPKAAAHA